MICIIYIYVYILCSDDRIDFPSPARQRFKWPAATRYEVLGQKLKRSCRGRESSHLRKRKLEKKLLLISINFTLKTSHRGLEYCYTMCSRKLHCLYFNWVDFAERAKSSEFIRQAFTGLSKIWFSCRGRMKTSPVGYLDCLPSASTALWEVPLPKDATLEELQIPEEIFRNRYQLLWFGCIILHHYLVQINDQWLILKNWLQCTHCARLWPNMWAGQCAVCPGRKIAPGTKWDQLLCITTFTTRLFCCIHFGMLICKMLTSLPCHLESKQVTKGVSSTRFAFAACQARVASDQRIIEIFLGNYAYYIYIHIHSTESSAVDYQPVLFPWSLLLPWQGDGSAVAWGSPFAGGDTSEAFGGIRVVHVFMMYSHSFCMLLTGDFHYVVAFCSKEGLSEIRDIEFGKVAEHLAEDVQETPTMV